jgi:hypothetical protein
LTPAAVPLVARSGFSTIADDEIWRGETRDHKLATPYVLKTPLPIG